MTARELNERIALERLRRAEHDREDLRHARLLMTLHKTGARTPGARWDDCLPPVAPIRAQRTKARAMTQAERDEAQLADLRAWGRRNAAT